jgi:predicted DNA-binding antitoxin AbrB/MazE fold protein
MSEQRVMHGIVKNGVIVPEEGLHLPEGASVKFVVKTLEFTPEEYAEFSGWDRLGDEAWAMIDEWEKEDSQRATG